MTRFWSNGLLIQVTTREQGGIQHSQLFGLSPEEVPGTFHWQEVAHHVEEIFSVWRVDIDWWRTRTWRTYFFLVSDSGLLVMLFQDLLREDWYLQRLYD